jgi:hypothetical protein
MKNEPAKIIMQNVPAPNPTMICRKIDLAIQSPAAKKNIAENTIAVTAAILI